MEITWRVISGEGRGEWGKMVQGLRSIIGMYKIDRGDVKNSIGNGEVKELICMTHGHELKGGWLEGRGIFRGRAQRGKNWDNCNSIINKIYFLESLLEGDTKRELGWGWSGHVVS